MHLPVCIKTHMQQLRFTFKQSSASVVVSPFDWTNLQNTVLYKLFMWPERN